MEERASYLAKEEVLSVRIRRWLSESRPVEISSAFFILIFLGFALRYYQVILSANLLVVRYVGLLLLILLARRTAELMEKRGWILFRDFLPVLIIFEVYDGLGYMLHLINPHDADPTLIRIDRLLFGTDPSLWMERFITPFLNDLMHLAYFSFYFLPLVLGIVLWMGGKKEAFHRLVMASTSAFYLCFVGYLLVPAVGPRYTLAHLYRVPLEGTPITDFIRGFVATAENLQWDCFPSGHTAVALVVLWYALREERKVFYPLLPISILLLISTVYCRYHYVIDVLAGMVVAALSVLLADWFEYISLQHNNRRTRCG
jgi:membrane-associated phospholipid phosphatase